MGSVALDTCVFGGLNRAQSAQSVAKTLTEFRAAGSKLVVPRAVYLELQNTPGEALRNAQLRQIADFEMQIQPEAAHADYIETYKQWAELGQREVGVGYSDMKVLADVRAYAKLNPSENVEFFTIEKMVNNKGVIEKNYGVKFSPKCRLQATSGEIVTYDPVKLGVKSAPVETPPPPEPLPAVPEIPLAEAGPGATESFMSAAKLGFKEGLKGLMSAEVAVGVAATVFMAAADLVAMKTSIRRIQMKFLKEGFAKGLAAGAMGWSETEVASEAMNRVTNFRLQGLADPAGYLTLSYMYKLAESVENYAVAFGYYYATRRALDWKKDWCARGFGLLARYGYDFGADPDVLFTYSVVSKLAWAMRAASDSIVEPAIRMT